MAKVVRGINPDQQLVGENQNQQHVEYLQMIQGIITRMSGNSAIMKGFAATVIAAVFGMAVADYVAWYHLLIAFVPVFAFIRLDIFYLQLEKRYRNLYALVAASGLKRYQYSLDLKADAFRDKQLEINKNSGFWRTVFSVSIWQFYGWFFAVAITLIVLTV